VLPTGIVMPRTYTFGDDLTHNDNQRIKAAALEVLFAWSGSDAYPAAVRARATVSTKACRVPLSSHIPERLAPWAGPGQVTCLTQPTEPVIPAGRDILAPELPIDSCNQR
jgi:hypothetical protein